jgi:hypothetical protein
MPKAKRPQLGAAGELRPSLGCAVREGTGTARQSVPAQVVPDRRPMSGRCAGALPLGLCNLGGLVRNLAGVI